MAIAAANYDAMACHFLFHIVYILNCQQKIINSIAANHLVKMDEIILRFPYLPEQIFSELDNKSLAKCRETDRSCYQQ